MDERRKACWVPTVNEELGPPVTADRTARWNSGTEDRLCQLNQLSEFMPELTDAKCWQHVGNQGSIRGWVEHSFFIVEGSACPMPAAKERLRQLGCRSQSGTNCSVVSSEASVLVAMFERSA